MENKEVKKPLSEEKKKEQKEFLQSLIDAEKLTESERVIQDNKIVFKVDDDLYRVRSANYDEQMEIETFRRKKYLEFVNKDDYLFKNQWIEKYKKKGIDISKIEHKILEYQDKIEKLMLRLAKLSDKNAVEQLEKEIYEIKSKQAALHFEKVELLSYCIEEQLNMAVTSFYCYIVLEVKNKENKWNRVFKNYDEFSKSDNTKLINKSFYNVSELIYGVQADE